MALHLFDSTHLRSLEEIRSAEQGPELSCEWPETLKPGKIERKSTELEAGDPGGKTRLAPEISRFTSSTYVST